MVVAVLCAVALTGPLGETSFAWADDDASAVQTESSTRQAEETLGRTNTLTGGSHLVVCDSSGAFALGASGEAAQAVSVGEHPQDSLTYTKGIPVIHVVEATGGSYLMCDGGFLSASDGLAWAKETTGSCVWQVEDAGSGLVRLSCELADGSHDLLAFDGKNFTITNAADDAGALLRLFATDSHLFEETRVEPTCTQDGAVVRTCVACGEKVEVVLEALGHDWGPWEVESKATVSEEGAETRTCRRDANHTETRVIPKASSEATSVDVTFDLAGGTLENVSDTLTVTSSAGSEVKMLGAPVREGYVFLYWESERYRLNPGDVFSVTSDDVFTAVWRPETLRDALEGSSEDPGTNVTVPIGTVFDHDPPSAHRDLPDKDAGEGTEDAGTGDEATKPTSVVGSHETPVTRDESFAVWLVALVGAVGAASLITIRAGVP